jgi:hypothetical protein
MNRVSAKGIAGGRKIYKRSAEQEEPEGRRDGSKKYNW